MLEILKLINEYVWGLPLIILLVGTGIYLTVILKGIQFTTLFPSLYFAFFKRKESGHHSGDISHFQALMTALAATVGTGNIAGVATAIAVGGPGAVFWMWVTGLVGMATKYSEALLAVKYRQVDNFNTMSGGPMYYIEKGLKNKPLAVLFALFASIAAFGIGNMIQAHSVADAVHHTFNVSQDNTALVLTLLTALVVMGGIKYIAKAASTIVPFMIVVYCSAALYIVVVNYAMIPEVFGLIFYHAFNPAAAAGGFAGALMMTTVRLGVSRGVLSNESGLGSSPIAAAAAKTDEPVRQALVSMTQTFIDTIIVCSMTAFAILATGVWKSGATGAPLTESAFSSALPGEWGGVIVTVSLIFFAYSTILTWCYYGEKSIEYLAGERSVKPYRLLFVIAVYFGALLKLDIVWNFADIMNGLMAIPNLIALIFLSGVVVKETNDYFAKYKKQA